MHFVFLNYSYDDRLFNSDKLSRDFINISESGITKISLVMRGSKRFKKENDHLNIYVIKDELPPDLRWWQEPEKVNRFVVSLQPDVVQVSGLNLPLHFRWLKRYLSPQCKLMGEHCGEKIWEQRKLWLQQFGLRVVDGFVFSFIDDARPWLKAAVILKRQPVFELAANNFFPLKTAMQIMDI